MGVGLSTEQSTMLLACDVSLFLVHYCSLLCTRPLPPQPVISCHHSDSFPFVCVVIYPPLNAMRSRSAVEGGSWGVSPLVKIRKVLGGSAPYIEHTVGWINS